MKILIACEETQKIAKEYRKLGEEAYSCDIQKSRGGRKDIHIKGDVLQIINGGIFETEDREKHTVEKWDIIIAHPPCTYITKAGATLMFNKYGEINIRRYEKMKEAVAFFMKIWEAECDHICIENPTPLKIANLPECSQVIEPYMFGDNYTKRTQLWLKGLPPLKYERYILKEKPKSWTKVRGGSKYRSETFNGIAEAIAKQYRGEIKYLIQETFF